MALYPGPTIYPGPDTYVGFHPQDVSGSTPTPDPDPTRPAWWPTVDDVARVINRFTIATDGARGGTYTTTTTPTADQVKALIPGVAWDVTNAAGTDLAAVWNAAPNGVGAGAAKRVIAYGVASEIVLSYYPASAANDIGDKLEARYTAALTRLLAGGKTEPDTGGGGGDDSPATPVGGFPPAPGSYEPPYLWRPW